MKKLLSTIVILTMFTTLAGCTLTEKLADKKAEETEATVILEEKVVDERYNTESGYTAEAQAFLDKFNSIELGMTKEEVDALLTPSDRSKIDPMLSEPINGKAYYYEDDRIQVIIPEDWGKVSQVFMMRENENNYEFFKNSKVKLSFFDTSDFVDRLNNGEKVYYDELVAAYGIEGISSANYGGDGMYFWVDMDGNHVNATLDDVFNDGDICISRLSYN